MYTMHNPVAFVDPSGLSALGTALFLIGGAAILGGGIDAAAQVATSRGNTTINMRSVAGSAAGSAAVTGLMMVPGSRGVKLGFWGTAAWVGASGGVGYNVNHFVSGTNPTVQGNIHAVMGSATMGIVGWGCINRVPAAPPSMGRFTGNWNALNADERIIARDLMKRGGNVHANPRSNAHGVKTPDFRVNGVYTELKTLHGNSLNTPVKRIREGFEQGAQTVIIDGRRTSLTSQQAFDSINRAAGSIPGGLPGEVEIWIREGIVFRRR